MSLIECCICRGQTALHHAAANCRRNVCCMLVAAGACLIIKDQFGQTPRSLARKAEDDQLAQYLESKCNLQSSNTMNVSDLPDVCENGSRVECYSSDNDLPSASGTNINETICEEDEISTISDTVPESKSKLQTENECKAFERFAYTVTEVTDFEECEIERSFDEDEGALHDFSSSSSSSGDGIHYGFPDRYESESMSLDIQAAYQQLSSHFTDCAVESSSSADGSSFDMAPIQETTCIYAQQEPPTTFSCCLEDHAETSNQFISSTTAVLVHGVDDESVAPVHSKKTPADRSEVAAEVRSSMSPVPSVSISSAIEVLNSPVSSMGVSENDYSRRPSSLSFNASQKDAELTPSSSVIELADYDSRRSSSSFTSHRRDSDAKKLFSLSFSGRSSETKAKRAQFLSFSEHQAEQDERRGHSSSFTAGRREIDTKITYTSSFSERCSSFSDHRRDKESSRTPTSSFSERRGGSDISRTSLSISESPVPSISIPSSEKCEVCPEVLDCAECRAECSASCGYLNPLAFDSSDIQYDDKTKPIFAIYQSSLDDIRHVTKKPGFRFGSSLRESRDKQSNVAPVHSRSFRSILPKRRSRKGDSGRTTKPAAVPTSRITQSLRSSHSFRANRPATVSRSVGGSLRSSWGSYKFGSGSSLSSLPIAKPLRVPTPVAPVRSCPLSSATQAGSVVLAIAATHASTLALSVPHVKKLPFFTPAAILQAQLLTKALADAILEEGLRFRSPQTRSLRDSRRRREGSKRIKFERLI